MEDNNIATTVLSYHCRWYPRKILSKAMPLLSSRAKKFSYKCTVRLLDDSEILQCEFLGKENGQYLIDQVCAHLDLAEKEYFGLVFEDGNKYKQWLEPCKPILKQVKEVWPMVLALRLKFYPGWPERLQEALTRYQVYLQLRRDLRSGRLAAADEELAHLAALVLQVETGDYAAEERPDRYVAAYALVRSASSRLEERIMELHCCQTRGLSPDRAELALLRRAAQLDMYGLRPQPFKDQRGSPVSLGLNYRGISVLQDGRRTNLLRWADVQKLNFENKMFIVHLVFVEDSRTKTKRTVGYKSDSVQRCRAFWRDATEHRLFFTCESGRSAPRTVLGGSLFSRHARVRFSGRTESEVARQPQRRDPPQFHRYGLRPSVRRKAYSVPATPCDSQGGSSGGAVRLPHDSPIPEHTSLADEETLLVPQEVPNSESAHQHLTPTSSPELSPVRVAVPVRGRASPPPSELTPPGLLRPELVHHEQDGGPLAVSVPAVLRRRPPQPPAVPPAPRRRRRRRRLLLLPLLRVLVYAVVTVAALVLVTLVLTFELDLPATRYLRTLPELRLLRNALYMPARRYAARLPRLLRSEI